MPYIGNNHIAGDHTNNFKVLDDISSYTATFDGSASSVVDTTNNTIRVVEHRFIQGQRVTYTNGSGGNIGGLTTGTAYFVIFDSASTIKLATSALNAASSTAINLSAVGTGSSHTLNAAFDGVNTKFKLTHGSGTGARLNNATQINVAINNVVQRPNLDPNNFTDGFALEDNHKIVFKVAPTSEDIFWGSIIANTLTTFDISDHKIDTFTGDGSTTEFTLSHTPANNESLMVTINGVLQHPSNASTARAYTLIASIIQFTAAPGVGDEIQVRHLGFAGATTADVSGFYGRTGNVVLTSNDHITTGNINAGIVTATSFDGTFSSSVGGSNANFTGIVTAGTFKGGNIDAVDGAFSGNVTIGGTLTYEDVTNIDSVGLITARNGAKIQTGAATTALVVEGNARVTGILTVGTGSITLNETANTINVGTALTLGHTQGLQFHTQNLHSLGFEVNQINASGIITASAFKGDGSDLTGIDATALKDPAGNVKIQAQASGAVHTGISTFQDIDVDGHTNLDNVSIAGVSTFADNTTFTGAASNAIWSKGNSSFELDDNSRLKIGNSADLSIYHNGSHSYIIDNGTGRLIIQSSQLCLQDTSGYNHIINNPGADVQLYYDFNNHSTPKLKTTATGITIDGTAVATGADINGDLDVDGHTNLDNVSVAGVTTFTGNISVTGGQLTLENGNEEQIHRYWTNGTDSDIYGLLSGSTFGTIVEGANNGHHVIALRDNDADDSFAIVSGSGNYQTDTTYDKLVARFRSNGNTNIGGTLDVAGETVLSSTVRIADTIAHIGDSNTKIRFPAADTITAETAGSERLRIGSDGTVSKYLNNTTVQAAFGGTGQVNGITALPSMAATPFVVGRDTGSTRSAHFGGHLKFDSGYGIQGTEFSVYGNTSGLYLNSLVSGDAIIFQTHNGSSVGERLRITSAGCVNIGGDYTQQDDRLSVIAGSGFEAIGIGGTNKGIRFGWDGDRSAYDDIRMYRVDYSNSGTYGIAGNLPCFVLTPTSAPGSGIVQETVWLKSTGRGSGNAEMNLMVDGDVVIGGDGQVPGGSQSGYPDSLVGGLGNSKLTIQTDDRTNAFSASDGTTWHDVVIKNSGGATSNATGIALEVSANNYHHNAGTGIAAVKDGNNSDYGCDLAFITRPHSAVAQERMRIRAAGGLRLNNTNSNEVHAISNYDHGNHDYSHRNGRTLHSNGTGWDGNQSSDGSDPILVLSVEDRAGNSDIGDAYGLCLHSDSQDDNDYGPLIGWSNRSNSGSYNTTYAAIVGQKTGQATDANWSSGALHFFTNKPGAGGYMNNVADISINEDGQVTMPRQPAFSATTSSTSSAGFIVFNQTSCNAGNHYSTSNGRFTAPVAGNYYFSFYGMSPHQNTSNQRVAIYVNGNYWSAGQYIGGVAYSGYTNGGYTHLSLTTALPLAVNDYVQINWQYSNLHDGHCKFTGFLIG